MKIQTAIAFFTATMVSLAGYAAAANLVGDADNSGTVDMSDVALALDYLYGLIGPSQISPLALVGTDSDLDLADLMLVGQAALGVEVLSGPGSLLSISHATDPSLLDGAPDWPVAFNVASNYPAAAMVDGLQVSVSMAPGESILSGVSFWVAGGQATATFTPINAAEPYDMYNVDLFLAVRNSANTATTELDMDTLLVTVAPPVCGDGVINGGEVCDDGDTNNCTAACDAICLGPHSVVCGDGVAECGEACDDGDTDDCGACNAACDGAGIVPTCGDGVAECGEACDDGPGEGEGDCQDDCSGVQTCGDGVTQGTEACDGATTSGQTEIGRYNTPSGAIDVEMVGNLAFVADGGSGLQILDIANPTPTWVGEYDTVGSAFDLAVFGDYAFIADGTNGLVAVDISNPAATTLAGSWNTPDIAVGVATDGARVYVADRVSGVLAFSVTNGVPSKIGEYPSATGATWHVDLVGDTLYVADSGALLVLDVANPTPVLIGSYNSPGDARKIHIHGTTAFLADSYEGVQILDVSTPTPSFIGGYNTPDYAHDVLYLNDNLYVADGLGGLVALDATNLASPIFLDSYVTGGEAWGLAANNTRLYLANLNGVLVFSTMVEAEGLCLADCSGIQNCGDGVANGSELCDDGDTNDCTPACDASCSGPHTVICGDGVAECGEACDDGDTTDCGPCNATCDGAGIGPAVCGDGAICGGAWGEVCDDGDTNDCTPACDASCSGPHTVICGDGVAECGEACDDGDTTDCGPCNATCDGAGIGPAVCGDGAICGGAWGEVCDDGDADDCTPACDANCSGSYPLFCGDGVAECGEACDDGDTDDCTPVCDATCSGPYPLLCGDGVAECGEACDDGDVDNCTTTCDAACMGPHLVVCGDGVAECGEVCDDGDASICAGPCNETCSGLYGGVCGDGAVEFCETCDDANTVSGDGCSSVCRDEADYCGAGGYLVGELPVAFANSGFPWGQAAISMASAYPYLYVLDSSNVRVIDVSDPANPWLANSWSGGAKGDIVTDGDYLYLSRGKTWDLSTSPTPTIVYNSSKNAYDADLDGPILFNDYQAWDVSNPAAPVGLYGYGNATNGGYCGLGYGQSSWVAVVGDWTYRLINLGDIAGNCVYDFVARRLGTSTTYGLTNDPFLGSCGWNPSALLGAGEMESYGDYVYISTPGIYCSAIFHVQNEVMEPVPGPAVWDSFRDFTIEGDCLYGASPGGLSVLSLANPASPSNIPLVDWNPSCDDTVTVGPPYLYCSEGNTVRVYRDLPCLCAPTCGNSTVEYPETCDDGNWTDGDGCNTTCKEP